MSKLRIPLPSRDPYREEKLERLTNLVQKHSIEVEEECLLVSNSTQNSVSELDSSDKLVSFQDLVKICETVTLNVLDLYFDRARDPRRGLFLLHKVLREGSEDGLLYKSEIQKALEEYTGNNMTTTVTSESEPSSSSSSALKEFLHNETKDLPIPSELTNLGKIVKESENKLEREKIRIHPALLVGKCEESGAGVYINSVLNSESSEENSTLSDLSLRVENDSPLISVHHSACLSVFKAYLDPRFLAHAVVLREKYDFDEEGITMAYLVFLKNIVLDDSESSGSSGGSSGPDLVNYSVSEEQRDFEHLLLKSSHGMPKNLDECPPTLLTWPNEAVENLYCPQVVFQVEVNRNKVGEFFDAIREVLTIRGKNKYEVHKKSEEDPFFQVIDVNNSDNMDMDDNISNCNDHIGTSTIQKVPTPVFLAEIDYEDALWARTIFDSRAFQLKIVLGEEMEVETSSEEIVDSDDDDESDDVEMLDASEEEEKSVTRVDIESETKRLLMKNRTVSNSNKKFKVVKGQCYKNMFFPEQDITVVVPVADYLNHSRQSTLMVPKFDNSSGCGGYFVLESACGIKVNSTESPSTESTSTSSTVTRQVFLNYGPLQNWEMLLYYGFCLDQNCADTLQLELGEPEDAETADLLARVLQIPTDHCLEFVMESESEESVETTKFPLSTKLLGCLRVLYGAHTSLLNKNNIDKDLLKEKVEDPVFNPADNPACRSDLEICDTLLGVFSQLLQDEDEVLFKEVMGGLQQSQIENQNQMLWESDPTYGPLCKKFRESQRKLVRSNINGVERYRDAVEKRMKEWVENRSSSSTVSVNQSQKKKKSNNNSSSGGRNSKFRRK